MPDGPDTLIVPTVLTTGTLHFAEVSKDSNARNVIDTLLSIEGLKEEVLGNLEDSGWALQKIRTEPKGRPWEEEELLAFGDGWNLNPCLA